VQELTRAKQQVSRANQQQTRATQQTPWWLEDDTEICSSCHQPYAYQTGTYCLDCDANVCSVCVQETVSIELLCHGCETARTTENSAEKERQR
jgi:hypothetical protein